MKKLPIIAALAMGLALLASPVAAAPASTFDLAVTVDDLPAHGSPTPGMSRVEIGRAYLAALKAHHVPEAYGFVNAVRLVDEPDSEQVLKDWRAAGYPLGSHTYSHRNLNQGTVAAFEADVVAGEPLLRQYMAGADWHYLRFPYLNAGDAALHQPVIAWLQAHHYRIAEASLGFDDWAYAEAYNRCLAQGDRASVAALQSRYLSAVDAGILRMKTLSQAVYDRMIPQVLLIHLGGFSAVTLPEVLNRLDTAGARYVPLAQALGDPAYAANDPRAGDGTVMERAASEKGIDISAIPPVPGLAGIERMCQQAPAPAQ